MNTYIINNPKEVWESIELFIEGISFACKYTERKLNIKFSCENQIIFECNNDQLVSRLETYVSNFGLSIIRDGIDNKVIENDERA